VLEDYGEVSRVKDHALSPALSAKLTRKDERMFLVLDYAWKAHHDVWRVDVTDGMAESLRRMADDIEKHRSGADAA
jgi:hypothetical protein